MLPFNVGKYSDSSSIKKKKSINCANEIKDFALTTVSTLTRVFLLFVKVNLNCVSRIFHLGFTGERSNSEVKTMTFSS